MPDERWTLGRSAVVWTLVIFCAWGSLLIIAVLMGRDAEVIGGIFSSIIFGVVGNVAILYGGKAAKTYYELKGIKNGSNHRRPAEETGGDSAK